MRFSLPTAAKREAKQQMQAWGGCDPGLQNVKRRGIQCVSLTRDMRHRPVGVGAAFSSVLCAVCSMP